MTLQEVGQIMDTLAVAYPQFYAKQTDDERYTASVLWATLFEPYPVDLVVAATKAFIAADNKGFPPAPGQIMSKIRLLTDPEELNEAEAWAMVSKAVSGKGLYRSKEAFDDLPPIVQRLVGSPNQLREWAVMDSQAFHTVEGSKFRSAYRRTVVREREINALPPRIRQQLKDFSEQIALNRKEQYILLTEGENDK